jgi:aminoglycoside phosphotransferase (APT) family kinase protein
VAPSVGNGDDIADLTHLDALGPMLADVTADDRWLGLEARLITGGKSNLTFELSSAAGELILRRPPSGTLLATAHDMGREARVQRALSGTDVPVPEVVLFDDGTAFGVPFYVMNKVTGHVIRDQLPPGLTPGVEQCELMGHALVDVLADLHAVDPAEVGLGDFGRPEGFLERQIRRWRRQWETSADVAVPVVEALAERLAATVPTSPAATIVHGDYRLDNCIVAADDPSRIAAVLDWEMSTVGDPLTDLGMLLFYWAEPGEEHRSLTPAVTATPGFPSRAEVARRWSERTGIGLDDLGFYEAFAHFKFAVIAQGVSARVKAGSMGGQDFGDLSAEIAGIANAGLELALQS